MTASSLWCIESLEVASGLQSLPTMHELSVASALYEWALSQSHEIEPRRLLSIELEQDSLSGLNADSVDFGFRALVAGTELEGVRLEWHELSPTYVCPKCSATARASAAPAACPHCPGAVPRLARTDSVRVRSIEVEPSAQRPIQEE